MQFIWQFRTQYKTQSKQSPSSEQPSSDERLIFKCTNLCEPLIVDHLYSQTTYLLMWGVASQDRFHCIQLVLTVFSTLILYITPITVNNYIAQLTLTHVLSYQITVTSVISHGHGNELKIHDPSSNIFPWTLIQRRDTNLKCMQIQKGLVLYCRSLQVQKRWHFKHVFGQLCDLIRSTRNNNYSTFTLALYSTWWTSYTHLFCLLDKLLRSMKIVYYLHHYGVILW